MHSFNFTEICKHLCKKKVCKTIPNAIYCIKTLIANSEKCKHFDQFHLKLTINLN